MSDWKKYRIGDLLLLEYGKSLSDYRNGSGKYEVFGTNGKIGYTNEFLFDQPSLIIGRKGAYREVHFAIKPFFVIDTAFYTKKKNDLTDTTFMYYWFKNVDINAMDSGSAIPSTSRDEVYDKAINLPLLPEQTAIAEVLSSLDDKIDLLHRQNKTLEELAETLFKHWIVEEAEESWEVGTVSTLIELQSGYAFKSTDFVDNGKYKLITIKNVQDGYLDISRTDTLYEIPTKMPDYCMLKEGDILLSLTGNVGRCCMVDEKQLVLNQRVAKLNPRNNRDWSYIYILFRQTSMRRLLEELAKGTAQANLSPVETSKMEIQIPPKALLNKFSNETRPLIAKVLKNKNQIKTLTRLRDTLLPKLMSGEVMAEH